MDKKNIDRLITPIIVDNLKRFGGILIEGPKWCGKTYQGLVFAKSKCMIQSNFEKYKNYTKVIWKRCT